MPADLRVEAPPADALAAIGAKLREQGTLLSECVRESEDSPALGVLAAAGPRTAHAPGAYAQVIESVREGYLLHYGSPRIVVTADRDLALLAGDYMYAWGLSLLAAIGDAAAVLELAELISLCAQAHSGDPGDVPALWLAAAAAIAAGSSAEHAAAKAAARAGEPAGRRLWVSASLAAAQAGFGHELSAAAETVGFAG